MSTTRSTKNTRNTTENNLTEPVNLDSFLEFVNLDMAICSKRLATFKDVWIYDKDVDAQCTSERVYFLIIF
jgi:hypothetical protein